MKAENPKTPQQPESAPSEVLATGPMFLPSERQRLVAEAAYYRYLSRGGEPGDPLLDWLEAEAKFNTRPPQA